MSIYLVIKTHAPAHLAPWKKVSEAGAEKVIRKIVPEGARVIVVTRNPKDVSVSLFHHTIDLKRAFDYTGDWDCFLRDLFMPGEVESGCYWEWTKTWWDAYQSQRDHILWISYEEMKADLPGSIRRVADFMGGVRMNELELSLTLEACSFETMKRVAAEEDAVKLSRNESVKPNHIRHGQVGGWRSSFSAEQLAVFEAHHAKMCTELGLPLDLFYE